MSEFDNKAATWDENPDRIERARAIANHMDRVLDLSNFDNALEYGSGTGLLSFALHDKLKNITLMDQSVEMIKVADAKCDSLQVNNIKAFQCDLLVDPLPKDRYDLIFTLLTLHHIDNISGILQKFYDILTSSGLLVIVDLEKEDGSFHDDEFHGHNGFEKVELESMLTNSGLLPSKYEVCYELEKEQDGEIRKYPLFMLVAQKD